MPKLTESFGPLPSLATLSQTRRATRLASLALVSAEARRSIDGPAAGAQNIGQPAKRLASYHMSVAVVDSFQIIQVEEQQGKLPARALAALDFQIEHIYEVAIVGQTGQRIAGCLPTEVILQLALSGDVFGNDLVGFQLAPLAENFSPAEPDLHDRMVLSLPFYFDGID